MLISSVILLVSLVFLVKSADYFVDGAAALAGNWGMSPLLVGMIVIGFGTSAPELLVSAIAALQGNSGIALGNVVGSNISNMALILGVAAMVTPLAVSSGILKKELPLLLICSLIFSGMLMDGDLDRLDGIILLGLFAVIMGYAIFRALKSDGDTLGEDMENDPPEAMSTGRALMYLVPGLIVLLLSSRFMVDAAVDIAGRLGVSDTLIGLTVVAIGTSLPELASSVSAARKGQGSLALGNVIGSNLFNTMLVMGSAAAIMPLHADSTLIYRDLPVMLVLTLSLFLVGYGFRGREGRINRWEGGGLLASYIAYTGWLIVSA